jgi:hypothetical protein
MPTIPDMLEDLGSADPLLPPVRFRLLKDGRGGSLARQGDAVIEVLWEGETWQFVAEIKTLSTPRAIEQAVAIAKRMADPPRTYPLIVVPYLSPEKLDRLVAAGVSGVDLCGNGALAVPGRMLVVRSGKANRFPRSMKLRNVYRGRNSLVARAFLLQPAFAQVKQIVELLNRRRGAVAFSTVSRALKRLEEDLVISRERGAIRLLQAETLLDKLAANYEAPRIKRRFRGKCRADLNAVTSAIVKAAADREDRVVLAGAASAQRYAVMAAEPVTRLYTSADPAALVEATGLEIEQTRRFQNLEIMQTTDKRVFFDTRCDRGRPFASPIQTFLELSAGDKRQKDAAEQVRQQILASLGGLCDDAHQWPAGSPS